MQAQITSLPISSDYYLQSKQPPQNTTTITALYYVLLIINFCSYFNYGYFISIPNKITTLISSSFNLPFIFSLSFICNIIFSFLPKRIYHKLFTKYFFISTLILHISARCFIFINSTYLLYISQILIGVTQTVISIYTLQWCLYFGNERERLRLIHRICLTPITAVCVSMIIEFVLTRIITKISVCTCIECGVMLICLITLMFIQSDYLENKTLNLTDEFLNKSLDNGDIDVAQQRSEINDKFCLLSLTYCVMFIQMVIFGRMIFGYNGIYTDHNIQWMVYKIIISFILPLCGLLFSAFLTYKLPYKNNLVVHFMFNFILFICGLALSVLSNTIQTAFNNNDTVMCYVIHGTLAFTNPMLLPFAYCFINSYIYSKEQNISCMKSITSVVNIAIIVGALSTAIHTDETGMIDVVMTMACIVSFAVFIMFISVSSCNNVSEKIDNKIKLNESYVYLIIASTFGKFVMFIWDECHSDELFDDINKYSGSLINSGDQVSSETRINVGDEDELNMNGINDHNHSNNGINNNNNNTNDIIIEEANYDGSKTSGVTFNANFIENINTAHSNNPHFPMQQPTPTDYTKLHATKQQPSSQDINTFNSTGFDIKQSLSSNNNINTDFFSFNANKTIIPQTTTLTHLDQQPIDDEFEAKIKGE